MKPRANVAKTIEKMMKKNHIMQLSSIHLCDGKAVFTNAHWLYILRPELIAGVDSDIIATDKETARNDMFSTKRYEKVVPTTAPVDKITLTYDELRRMEEATEKNEWGRKDITLETESSIIRVVADNLINACRIFKAEEITLNLFENHRKPETENGKTIRLSPFTVEHEGNLLVCAPVARYAY